jgi:hypothetical protein
MQIAIITQATEILRAHQKALERQETLLTELEDCNRSKTEESKPSNGKGNGTVKLARKEEQT